MSKKSLMLTPDELKHFKLACPKCKSLRTSLDSSTDGRDNIKFRCESCRHVWRVLQSELDKDIGLPESWSRPKKKAGGRKASSNEEEETDMAKKKAKGKKSTKKAARGGKTKAKKATKTAGKKLTVVAHVLAMLGKNPKLTAEQFVVGVRKQFPKSIQRPAYFGGYVKTAIAKGIIKASDRE